MKPSILLVETLLFIACFLVHLGVWRLSRPQNQGAALLTIFSVPLIIFAIFFGYLSKETFLCSDIFSIVLLHIAISSAYIQTYPALEGLSPSLIILILTEKTFAGLTKEELRGHFMKMPALDEKIQSLIRSQFVLESGGKLAITTKGKAFVLLFIILRRLLGLDVGRG